MNINDPRIYQRITDKLLRVISDVNECKKFFKKIRDSNVFDYIIEPSLAILYTNLDYSNESVCRMFVFELVNESKRNNELVMFLKDLLNIYEFNECPY